MRRSRHHPRPERPPNLRTLGPNGPVHLKNLPPLNPMNPGCGAAHPAAPFRLAALATHPREGGGQVTWRGGTLPQTLPIPFCGGGKRRPRPSNLPPTARRGEGDHEVVEGGRRRRPYKTCGESATTTLGLKGRQTYKPSGPTGRSILRTFPSEPYEPGLRSGPSSRPLPSRCARHPPPGRGWAGNMEERNVASN